MDRLLRAYQAFARAYIDDIVVFSVIMEDYTRKSKLETPTEKELLSFKLV